VPTTSPPLIPLPPADVPLIDPKTGLPTRAYYEWVERLQAVVKKIRTEIP